MSSSCNMPPLPCDSPEAIACVDEWIAGGFADNEELFTRCAGVGPCAYKAQQEGRCHPNIDIVPITNTTTNHTVPRNCAHLGNCSHHGTCVGGKCVCSKG